MKNKKLVEYKDYYVVMGELQVYNYGNNPAYSYKYLPINKSRRFRKRFKTKEEAMNFINGINL